MDRRRRIGILSIPIIQIMLLIANPIESAAQTVTYLNDKAKTYQVRSMENGTWQFEPGLYYILLHKKYSGAYMKGLKIKYDQKKSNVKQIAPVRAAEVLLEAEAANKVQNQIDSIQPLALEETIRSGERMVDLMYGQYESKFKESFDAIDELTKIINNQSKGLLLEQALAIIDEKDLIKEEIDYIHETGLTKQMEQAKRQLAYEDVLKKLDSLIDKSFKLAYYAKTLNNLKK